MNDITIKLLISVLLHMHVELSSFQESNKMKTKNPEIVIDFKSSISSGKSDPKKQ